MNTMKVKSTVAPFPAKAHWSEAMEGDFKLTASQTCYLARCIESALQTQQGKISVLLPFACSKMYQGQGAEHPNLSLFDPSWTECVFSRLVPVRCHPPICRADRPQQRLPKELRAVTIRRMFAHYLTLCSLYEAPQEKFLSDFSTKKSCNSLEQ